MHLSGRANWWLPGWLDRLLPHLSIEPATRQPAAPSPAPAMAAASHLALSGRKQD
jgi:putative drug exporter of the RND superfamily